MNFDGDSTAKANIIEIKEENLLAILVEAITDEASHLIRNLLHQGHSYAAPYSTDNVLSAEMNSDSEVRHLFEPNNKKVNERVLDSDKDPASIVKSLQWPGLTTFHNARGNYGFVYFGNGRKNFDVLFI